MPTLITSLLLLSLSASAHERSGPSGDSGEVTPQGPPCAVIDKFGGDVQILDASRTKLQDPTVGMAVGCGSWISVSKGWVSLKHQGGALIRLGAASFARLKDDADPLVLHHGEAHLTAGHGRGPMRAITPNARATLKRGTAILIYSPEEEDSQLIALENEAQLENRFEPANPVRVRAGEGSSLNFKLLRVVPSAPRAVSLAALRKHLSGLRLEGKSREFAVGSVQKRQERTFAASTPKSERAPASVKNYARHPAGVDDSFVRRTMARKVAGDERAGDAVLHPNRGSEGKPIKGHAEVQRIQESEDSLEKAAALGEAAEKQRLIDELSKIKDEQ